MSIVERLPAPDMPEVGFDPAGVLAKARSENFPVASFLLPSALRKHLLALYGYCRLVDDVGDLEPGNRDTGLDWVEAELDAAFEGRATHRLFVDLAATITDCSLSREPFANLLAANRLDQVKVRYATFDELRSYCELSANPVGRLVLGAFSLADPVRVALSDDVCSGLQVVEHLQDVAEDFAAGRIYLPAEDLGRFGVAESELGAEEASPALRRAIAFEAGRAAELLASGVALLQRLRGASRVAVAGFVGGGLAQLDALGAVSYEVLGRRAKATPGQVARRSFGALRAARRRQ